MDTRLHKITCTRRTCCTHSSTLGDSDRQPISFIISYMMGFCSIASGVSPVATMVMPDTAAARRVGETTPRLYLTMTTHWAHVRTSHPWCVVTAERAATASTWDRLVVHGTRRDAVQVAVQPAPPAVVVQHVLQKQHIQKPKPQALKSTTPTHTQAASSKRTRRCSFFARTHANGLP